MLKVMTYLQNNEIPIVQAANQFNIPKKSILYRRTREYTKLILDNNNAI
jgi:hypothetical protein